MSDNPNCYMKYVYEFGQGITTVPTIGIRVLVNSNGDIDAELVRAC